MGRWRAWWLVVVAVSSSCGIGVGAFRGKERFGSFATADQSGVRDGYERRQTERWTDAGEDFGVSLGLNPSLVVASPLGGGKAGVGYGFDAHLNFRWRMLELTGGYSQARADFEGGERLERNGFVVGFNYYLLLDDSPLVPYLGAAFQVGDVCSGAQGCDSARVEDVLGGRGSLGLALVLPEAIFETDLMLRLEGRFVGTQPVVAGGRTGSFLGGAVALEALTFF